MAPKHSTIDAAFPLSSLPLRTHKHQSLSPAKSTIDDAIALREPYLELKNGGLYANLKR